MKKIIYCLLFIVYCLCACSDTKKSNKESERGLLVKYKIRCVTEYASDIRFGAEQKEHINHVRLFNAKGLLTKETLFSSDGSMDFFAIHEYDKNDNLIVTKAFRPDSSFFYKETKSYDGNNNMIEKVYFEEPDGPFFYKNTATYDDKGRMIEYYWWWPTELKAKNTFLYDGTKMIAKMEHSKDGNFLYKWVYKYDEAENLIEAVQYYPDSLINSKIIYEYDKNNRKVRQTNYYRGTIQKITTYEYNQKHLMSSRTEYSSAGRISARYRYQYE